MAGKGILILVLGFIAIMGRFGIERNTVITRSVEKMANYYDETNAYNVAVAGANLAFSRLNISASVTNPIPQTITMNNVSFNGGTFSISCAQIPGVLGNYRLTSTGRFRNSTAFVEVNYQAGSFGQYAYYSENEAPGGGIIWWMARDRIRGPFHTQGNLNVSRHPFFGGDVTINGILKYQTKKSTDYPVFEKSFTTGVNRPMPDDGLNRAIEAANANGKVFSDKDTVYLTFVGLNVKYKYSWKGTETTTPITTLAPNGTILVQGGILRIKGNVDGCVTVVANDVKDGSKGDIYLDDNITLTGDPRNNPNCNDYLGICAANDVWITKNTPNKTDIKIDAAIYCQWGGFGAETYSNRGDCGEIDLYGGIVQRNRKAVSTFDGDDISSGFAKNYNYDQRFAREWPPYYPMGRNFRIVSWYDGPSKTN